MLRRNFRPANAWHRKTYGIKHWIWCLLIVGAVVLVVAIVPAVIVTRKKSQAIPTIDWRQITSPRGDRLPDFSYCGYHASAESLPSAQSLAAVTLSPQAGGGDDTTRIQDALNTTAAAGGGVVALAAGDFAVSPGLYIPAGVVLRGAGPASTRLAASKLGQDPLISLGASPPSVLPVAVADITDRFVPIGASHVTVDDVSGFHVGQSVFVQRLVTSSWVQSDGMGDLVLNGTPETWLKVSTSDVG